MPLNFCPKCGARLTEGIEVCVCGYEITPEDVKKGTETKPQIDLEKSAEIPGIGIKYSGAWDRIIAILVDMLCVMAIALVIGLMFQVPFPTLDAGLIVPNIGDLINWVVGFLWFWLWDTYHDGQTLGKWFMNIRTVDEDDFKPLTRGKSAINNILRGYGALMLIDFIVGFISNYDIKGRRLRIMQNASNSVVIKTK